MDDQLELDGETFACDEQTQLWLVVTHNYSFSCLDKEPEVQ